MLKENASKDQIVGHWVSLLKNNPKVIHQISL